MLPKLAASFLVAMTILVHAGFIRADEPENFRELIFTPGHLKLNKKGVKALLDSLIYI